MTAPQLRPLAGWNVLVTRPDGQGDALAALIAEAGGEPLLTPLLAIAPAENPDAAAHLLHATEAWDWLIFISANAVRHALQLEGWRALTARIAAVGEATAAALEAAGLRVDLVPYPQFNSEALLADPRMQAVAGQRILIVRGEGGREHLAEVLRERGAEVVYAEVYRRMPVLASGFAPALEQLTRGDCEAIVVTSGEALTHLRNLLHQAGLPPSSWPPLAVPGERIAGLAHTQGWTRVLVADQASDEAIVQSLKRLAHARRISQDPFPRVAVTPVAALEEAPAAASQSSLPEPALKPEPEPPIAPDTAPEPLATALDPVLTEPGNTPETDASANPPIITPESEHDGDTSLTDSTKDQQAATAAETANEAANPSVVPESGKGKGKGKPAKTPAPNKPRSMAWVGYLILLGVIGLAVGGWFLLQELRSRQEGLGGQLTDKGQQVQEVTHQLSSVQSELAALHSQLATLQTQFSGSDAKFERRLTEQAEQLDVKLDAARAELGDAVQAIQRQLNKSRGDLLITDAEYLLSVANQKLNLVGDVKSVLAAMEAADQKLHESADPAVYKVREVLAGEMAALRKIQAPDVVGVSSRLIALQRKVPSLPLILPHAGTVKQHETAKAKGKDRPSTPAATEGEAEAESGDALDSALEGLKDLVTVRRTDQPVEALLTPEQVEALRQLLLMKLESTRAALLRNDEQLYRDSLAAASEWVEQHFDGKAAETQAMLEELRALADRSLNVAYPDISKSMLMLQNIESLRLEAEDAVMRGKKAVAPVTGETPNVPAAEPAAAVPEAGPAPVAPPSKTEAKPVKGKKGKSVTPAATPAPSEAKPEAAAPAAPAETPIPDAKPEPAPSEAGQEPAASPAEVVPPAGGPEMKPLDDEPGERL
ncbi:MAG: fused uroporphyrinogen-III synthase HemD/membrane protein HemX [Methylococcus sp.]|nr:MAG: fused uroporphyrinogen-III synthase HemD/membrane protein HemX [Methylococcus sp.]